MRVISRAIEAMNKLAEELKRFNDHTDAGEVRENGSAVDPQTLEALERLKKRKLPPREEWEVRLKENLNKSELDAEERLQEALDRLRHERDTETLEEWRRGGDD